MEQKVTELIKKMLESESIKLDDLNEIIQLHKKIEQEKADEKKPLLAMQKDNNLIWFLEKDDMSDEELQIRKSLEEISERYNLQLERLENVIIEKVKNLNFQLSENFISRLINILFHRVEIIKINDVRIVNKNEIVIITDDAIIIGDSFNEIGDLDDITIQEEAYLTKAVKLKSEPNSFSPAEEFPEVYSYVENNIQQLLVSIGLYEDDTEKFVKSLESYSIVEEKDKQHYSKHGETNVYFDVSMWDFYQEKLSRFKMLITTFPNIIQIYDVKITEKGWVAKQIEIDNKFSNDLQSMNCSLLNESDYLSYIKQIHTSENRDFPRTSFDVEIDMKSLILQPFTLENLLKVYGKLFKDSNYIEERENKWLVSRLKFITAEKYAQSGTDYLIAQKYANAIFNAIDDYKSQISRAIEGTDKFPDDSLIRQIKKLEYPSAKASYQN